MPNSLVSRTSKIAFWNAMLCSSLSLLSQTAAAKPEASAAPTYTPHMVFDVASIRESGAGDFSYVDNAPKSSMYHAERIIAAAFLLSTLRQELGKDVIDHTGLSGMYAYYLMWAPTEMPEREGEERYPNLVDAVREQLGQEPKKTKGPVTFWAVDSMKRPTPN